ncbi:MAG: response regulator transcription factor [Methylobacillus sp.]|nr:response regulator transcription factor [Methylobacillus sp.]
MVGIHAAYPPLPAEPIRVGVVEDDKAMSKIFTDAIAAAGDMRLVFTASSREEALSRLSENTADVLLTDLGLPDGSGLDVISAASARWPDCAILVSTVFGDESSVFRAIEAGARGYLLKDADASQLAHEIRTAHAGGSPISPLVARKILGRINKEEAAAPVEPSDIGLTPREQEVLRFISRGFTADEVAQLIGISKHTVLTFVRHIYRKLEVDSKVEAVNEARRMGLLA